MNQPLDNFFREKLEHAHKPAPPAAWDRIDAGIDGRRRKGLWLKIAASLLIVATAAFIIWSGQHSHDTQWVAKRSTVDSPQSAATENPDTSGQAGSRSTDSVMKEHVAQSGSNQAEQVPATTDPSSPAVALHAATRHKAQKPRTAIPAVTDTPGEFEQDQQQVAVADQDHEVGQLTFTEPIHESVTPVQPAPASADVVLADAETDAENDQAITLVYTAAEINAKYLDKEALEKATSAQKKPSTFRKLLDKAYDLKNNQDPMGGLRQKKNEILALNFKSEKRSQNK